MRLRSIFIFFSEHICDWNCTLQWNVISLEVVINLIVPEHGDIMDNDDTKLFKFELTANGPLRLLDHAFTDGMLMLCDNT